MNLSIKSQNMSNIFKLNKKESEKDVNNNLEEELEKELDFLEKNKAIIDINLSEEQDLIVESTSNVIVDAVAGSGKTTTILHMALKYPKLNILQITYNNMLKHEVRKKVSRLAIENMSIHTYHSLAVKYYNESAYTDEEIKKILIHNTSIKDSNTKPIDILLIDETQDMAQDYYNLVKKFISDTKSNPKIVVMGDRYQGIYEFKGANSKFLTLADRIWGIEFEKLTLSISYRLTNQIAWFINKVMLGINRINTIKLGPPVDYYIGNSYEIYKKIGKQIRLLIKNEGIKDQDIFILSPSVKSLEPPFKKLENYLVKHGHKCTTPTSDDAKLDEKVISNKIVFTTYHQAKGRERKVVILYNFDDSYTQFFIKKTDPISSCPNILYVGATRASYKLILIQDNKYKPLNFLNPKYLKQSQNLNIIVVNEQNLNTINIINNKSQEIKKTSVTDMIKFLSPQAIDLLINIIDNEKIFETRRKAINQIDIPNKIKIINTVGNKEIVTYEDVSDLNGLVIPAIYEKILLKKVSTIESYIEEQIKEENPVLKDLKKYIRKIKIPANNTKDFLRVGNLYTALQNKLYAKMVQIKKYDWLDLNMVLQCHNNMSMIYDENIKFEIPIVSNESENCLIYEHKEFGEIHITSRLDAIDEKNVWEFKCVDYLTLEHKLQLLIYAWAYNKTNMNLIYGNKEFLLLNIKTAELLLLKINQFVFDEIIEIILQDKYSTKKVLDDEEFIKMVNKN